MIQKLPVYPAFEENNLPIILESSDFFAPYAAVTMLSIIENTTREHNYDLLVLTWDMEENTAQKLISMADGKENISIRVVDVAEKVKPYEKSATEDPFWYRKFSSSWIVRLIFPWVLEKYDLILNVDCDMLVCGDVAELFEVDLSEYYFGGMRDILHYVMNSDIKDQQKAIEFEDYVHNRLRIGEISEYMSKYLNGGMWLINLSKIRKDYTQDRVVDFTLHEGKTLTYFDQDAYNVLYNSKKYCLPMEWNWEVDVGDFIKKGKNALPVYDSDLMNYYETEKHVKNYHFATLRKPWNYPSVPYAEKWWEVARRSVMFSEILSRVGNVSAKTSENMQTKKEKYLLFVCDGAYQLVNILNIKTHYYPDIPADIMLCSSTALINSLEKIKSLGLFNEIIVSEYNAVHDVQRITDMPIEERTLHPERFDHMPDLEGKYTDLFIPVARLHFHQMIFYCLVKSGRVPAVHIFDEGGSTYVDNLRANEYKVIDHSKYPEDKRFYPSIKSIYLYRPDLYCGSARVQLIPIPRLSTEDREFDDLLLSIFGRIELPKEKYLFFNESFSEDEKISSEIQILDAIAELVGKENIAVKMHPRSQKMEQLYRFRGYRIFSNGGIPWELSALSPQIHGKVLMAISSNAIWTPLVAAGEICQAVSFLYVMTLSRRYHARVSEYHTLMQKIYAAANMNKNTFYMPRSLLELKNVIRFIEGES